MFICIWLHRSWIQFEGLCLKTNDRLTKKATVDIGGEEKFKCQVSAPLVSCSTLSFLCEGAFNKNRLWAEIKQEHKGWCSRWQRGGLDAQSVKVKVSRMVLLRWSWVKLIPQFHLKELRVLLSLSVQFWPHSPPWAWFPIALGQEQNLSKWVTGRSMTETPRELQPSFFFQLLLWTHLCQNAWTANRQNQVSRL